MLDKIGGQVGEVGWNIAKSFVNPRKLKRTFGRSIGNVIRKIPANKKDSTRPKEKNKGLEEPSLLDKGLARFTWSHILGAGGILASLYKSYREKYAPKQEEETSGGVIKWITDKIFNMWVGVGLIVLGEMSYHGSWFEEGKDWLKRNGVLVNVTETKKWKEHLDKPEFKDFLKDPTKFPLKLTAGQKYLMEIISSPHFNRTICFEGTSGNGKTYAAFVCAYSRNYQMKKLNPKKYKNCVPLVIDNSRLLDVAKDYSQNVSSNAEKLGGLGSLLGSDFIMDALDELRQSVDNGDVPVYDEAGKLFSQVLNGDTRVKLQDITDEAESGLMFTCVEGLKETLRKNQHLTDDDRMSLLQRIDSISFPTYDIEFKMSSLKDSALEAAISADITKFYQRVKKLSTSARTLPQHHSYWQAQQIEQWKDNINSILLDGGWKFKDNPAVAKAIKNYFTERRIKEYIREYPMNPRYIELTIGVLGILLNNRRNKSAKELEKELPVMMDAILQGYSFKNYVRSLNYHAEQEESSIVRNDTFDLLYETFGGELEDQLRGHKIGFDSPDLIQQAHEDLGIFNKLHGIKEVSRDYGVDRVQSRVGAVNMGELDFYISTSREGYCKDRHGNGRYDLFVAVDKRNPKKVYRGYIKYESGKDTELRIVQGSNKGATVAMKDWFSLN